MSQEKGLLSPITNNHAPFDHNQSVIIDNGEMTNALRECNLNSIEFSRFQDFVLSSQNNMSIPCDVSTSNRNKAKISKEENKNTNIPQDNNKSSLFKVSKDICKFNSTAAGDIDDISRKKSLSNQIKDLINTIDNKDKSEIRFNSQLFDNRSKEKVVN